MQGSRGALLQGRATALEKKGSCCRKHLTYKISLSLVLFLWAFIFLLNFLTSHAHDFKDETEAGGGESCHETQPNPINSSDSRETSTLSCMIPDHTVQNTIPEGKIFGHSTAMFASENGKGSSLTFVKAEAAKEIFDSSSIQESETPMKSEKLSRVAPRGLDEFKSKTIAVIEKPLSSQTSTVVHRL
ncbi:uncharacterized protein A4U43_C05F34500 [Asparagus officinalis]|uniref:Uncharacterized protein n=1 Tax=Asparagus officinalis TaxID=4686 RepID=A0A5P1EWR2_ASPOF|nr:uncharacterized protein LOC109842609 [Asparagus officinalis]ONK70515.1 uncharacterized protein A4U43_C05F34500 [Asparagus officinalis]